VLETVAHHHDLTVTHRICSIVRDNERDNDFTNENLIVLSRLKHASTGSSQAGPSTRSSNCSRIVPDDDDLYVEQLFGTKKDLQEAVHQIALKHNFEFKVKKSNKVALQFVHEMQHKAQKNFDASRDESLPVFGVGVAYIDERAIFTVPSHDFDRAIDEMKLIVSNLAPPVKHFHILPTESIYSSDTGARRLRLMELINAVSDVTGKEDLLEHLRMLSLQKIAVDNGYTKRSKPVLGTCTSRIACHVLEATVKEENSSRESTILRTAGKLEPLSFNRILEVDDSNGQSASQQRRKKYNLKPTESHPPETFCSICHSPLKKSDTASLNGTENAETSVRIFKDTCSSCQYQILPLESSSLEFFHSLLPQQMISLAKNSGRDTQKSLREEIQDCLLSDSEDET
ncbi:cytoplasmic tRNA 2-thiolation 2, partial [Olea europaea subsp. europaea]